jgi:hypothetical protein
MKLPLTGGCICGSVRYQITAALLSVYACHCTDCQRVTSSAFSIGVVGPASAFRSNGSDPQTAPGGVTSDGGLELHNGNRLIPERDRFRLEPRGDPRVNASST